MPTVNSSRILKVPYRQVWAEQEGEGKQKHTRLKIIIKEKDKVIPKDEKIETFYKYVKINSINKDLVHFAKGSQDTLAYATKGDYRYFLREALKVDIPEGRYVTTLDLSGCFLEHTSLIDVGEILSELPHSITYLKLNNIWQGNHHTAVDFHKLLQCIPTSVKVIEIDILGELRSEKTIDNYLSANNSTRHLVAQPSKIREDSSPARRLRNDFQSLNTTLPESSRQSSTSGNMNEFVAENPHYRKIWGNASISSNNDFIIAAKNILNDYTFGGNNLFYKFWRIISFKWRHHYETVDAIANRNYNNPTLLLNALQNIKRTPNGSLDRRIRFIATELHKFQSNENLDYVKQNCQPGSVTGPGKDKINSKYPPAQTTTSTTSSNIDSRSWVEELHFTEEELNSKPGRLFDPPVIPIPKEEKKPRGCFSCFRF